jgi:cytochrome c
VLRSSAIALVCATAGLLLAGCGASHETALRQQSGWGQGVYSVNCARCHDAGRSAGELTGTRLVASFSDAATLQRFVLRAMPYDRRGILTPADSWAVTAWLLDRNGLLQLRHDYLLGPKTAPTQRLGGDVPQTGRTAP